MGIIGQLDISQMEQVYFQTTVNGIILVELNGGDGELQLQRACYQLPKMGIVK